jgi:predicted phosphodiesterase
MPRFRIFSDVHSEFHRDGGRAFVDSLPDVPCDAVLLAGDVGDSRTFLPLLRAVCDRFADTPVLYVAGNHEHYGSDLDSVRAGLTHAARSIRNLVHLDNTVADVVGVRVAGATLWFPDHPMNPVYRHMMYDFRAVRNLDPAVYAENRRARQFIDSARADVVLTHHIPCYAAVAPRRRGSELNRFFVGGDEAMVAASGAKAWVFGHTHDHTDVIVDGVRMIANPFGYPSEFGAGFIDDLVLEV